MSALREPRPLASEPRIESPYLTAKEASEYLRFASVTALYSAVKKAGIPHVTRGRTLLFHKERLDRWLETGSRVVAMRRG